MLTHSITKWQAVITNQEADHARAIAKQQITVNYLTAKVDQAKEELHRARAALDEAFDDLDRLLEAQCST